MTNTINNQFSCFHRPIYNHHPCGVMTLFDIFLYLTCSNAVETQRVLRAITDDKIQKKYKDANFDWVTPAGIFSYANDESLIKASGVMCMDIDYLCLPSDIDEEKGDPVTELKEKLLRDPYFETFLLFRSPRGCGLKWWVPVDLDQCDHRTWFTSIRNYMMRTYHLSDIQADKQVINMSRGCFLGHDDHCHLHKDFFQNK